MKQEDEDDVEKLEKDDEVPLKQGFLTKKVPQKHSWKPAWFVLKPRSLCIYANAWVRSLNSLLNPYPSNQLPF